VKGLAILLGAALAAPIASPAGPAKSAGRPPAVGTVSGRALPEAVVYRSDPVTRNPDAGESDRRLPRLRLEIEGGEVRPRVSVAVRNSTLLLVAADDEGSDLIAYYGVSDVAFRHKLVEPGEHFRFTLARPGLMMLENQDRPGRYAWLYVTPYPQAAVAGADGGYEIRGVPAGRRRFAAWSEKFGLREASVLVRAGETVRLDFGFGG
jgi:hypothetical protein